MELEISDDSLEKELFSLFGFSKFKGLQKPVIQSVLAGQDTFVIMPTGGGKSLCYQLPALISEGTAIVVSPLIALMKNQVDAIRSYSDDFSVAHVLNSSLTKGELNTVIDDLKNARTKLLYVAPESLTKPHNIKLLSQLKISFVAIDEAHCISEWGHDFRPEYRNLKSIIARIDSSIPVIGLTATATPKVQEDIIKNLGMNNAKTFKASFNRPNLYYEVRPKTKDVDKDIIKFISSQKGKSGIIYCLSRKTVEQLAQTLQVNSINAVPYHAGFDNKTRAKYQDMFLMEDVEVVVATIAFGMGIDKPDVRFVIHYDMPKSIESYYQETGRAGRDGGEGQCIAFYAPQDIEKLEKFMANKPVAEQEIGVALLHDIMAYAETSISRRKFILNYFGEDFDEVNGEGAQMDDNTRYPKERFEAKNELLSLLKVVRDTAQKFKTKEVVLVMRGEKNSILSSHKTDERSFFGCGSAQTANFWNSLIRQSIIEGLLSKDVEQYGVLKLTKKGADYMETPVSFMMSLNRDFDKILFAQTQVNEVKGVLDDKLLQLLKALRKTESKKRNLPPFVIFQDPSLEDMVSKYPVTVDELSHVHGVSETKAKKYGQPFLDLISSYVEENNITRPDDMVIRSTGLNSASKLYVIQSVDRKLPLDDIADAKGMEMDELIQLMEQIVYSGTKLNIEYWIDEILDEDQQEELHDYFIEAETDSLEDAMEEFDGDFDYEELNLFRLSFLSKLAN